MQNERIIKIYEGSNMEYEMSLYRELGQFFSANGVFDEVEFSNVFTDHLRQNKEIAKKSDNENKPEKIVETFVSDYLGGILGYLTEKGMFASAASLFSLALEKTKAMGVARFYLSPELLEKIIKYKSASASENVSKRKSNDEKRKRIFEAALKVFGEDGFYRATMDKIASLSDMGKGSLYRQFKSKDELLEQLLEEKYKDIVEKITLIFNNSTDIVDGMVDMIVYWVNYINDNPVVYNLIQSADVTSQTMQGKTRFYKYMTENLPLLKAKIISLSDEHKVKGVDYLTVMYGFFGFIDGVVHKWFGSDMSYPLTDEIPVILETLFNGCVGELKSKKRFLKD